MDGDEVESGYVLFWGVGGRAGGVVLRLMGDGVVTELVDKVTRLEA